MCMPISRGIMLLLVIICCICYTNISIAQNIHTNPPERGKVEFTRLGIDEGLSLGGVNCITQDRYGFLWVGTQDGLNRYDGYAFTVYRRKNRFDTVNIRELWIESILEDKQGTLWIGGGRALHRFIRHSNTFEEIRLDKFFSIPSGLLINRLREDSKGNIWICTHEGLICYHPDTKVANHYVVPIPNNDPRRPMDIEVLVEDILEDSDGTFFVACGADGLYRLSPNAASTSTQFQRVHLANLSTAFEKAVRLIRDENGMIWMGTMNGLVRWSPTTKAAQDVYLHDDTQKFYSLKHDYFHIEQSKSSVVKDITLGRNGTVWIGTANGLYALDRSRKYLKQFLYDPFDVHSLAGNNAFAVYEDAAGVLWVGDYSYGLSKYPQEKERFITYRNNPIDPNSLSNSYVRGLMEDSKGNIWACTQYGGLNMLNRTTGHWLQYRVPSSIQASPNARKILPSDNVWAIAEDKHGEMWLGLYGGGVVRLNPQTQAVTRFTGLAYQDESICCIFRDKQDNIWLGGTNVYKVSPEGRVLKMFPFRQTLVTQTIFQDRHDVIWLGRDDGLWKVIANDSLIAVPLPEKNVVVTMINEDSRGNLWATTKGHGVFIFSPNRAEMQRLTVSEGLPHANIYAALEDANGEIWFSSDNGLARYNLQTKKMRLYSAGDGLQSQEFNRRAFGATARGELMFGGINGLNIFNPSSLRDNTTPPPVALTQVQARGRTIAESSQLLEMQELRLSYTDNFLQFSFAALEYSNPQLNRYSYKLDGLDEEWIFPAPGKHEATYTNLSPGTYTFHIRAANADGYWNNEGRMLKLIIQPPWWQTVWAYIAYSAAGVGVLSLIFFAFSRRQKREFMHLQEERERKLLHDKNEELLSANAQLQMLNMEKNEILGIVSHDLKNPIGGVRGLAELVRQGFAPPDQIPIIAEQIVHTSDRMFDLVRNLLDINQLESGTMQFRQVVFDIALTVNFTIDSFANEAERKNITILTEISPEQHYVLADERAMTQVVENLISNALKYSPFGKTVYVRLSNQGTPENGDVVRCEIQDEGQGLSESDKGKLFGKFTRLSARPTGGEHSTGLGLSIVKRLVEGMNGKVWCESELGHGATFIFTMPLITPEAQTSLLSHKEILRYEEVSHPEREYAPLLNSNN